MYKLGMITIGQSLRSDVAPIVERALEERAELVKALGAAAGARLATMLGMTDDMCMNVFWAGREGHG
ncbi:protein aroM [Paenibacillus sp. EKM202P]|uniref:AroM family protein n=1 Tax=unclassified Paenibacillus TaxID=185978 RepID=UPI0013EAE688|nr:MULTISPECIES: AroM family protein [unclassified Paenibacillus]KAF6564715.1 protein aroM [Paenibacillus sp. EKM202P]KAF6571470.1 protein aroM [Paenibacillus sp. EKM207P]